MMLAATLLTAALAGPAAAAPPSPGLRTLETAALARLAGPAGCRRFRLDIEQSASLPPLGSDREILRAEGRLESGRWSGLQESTTVVADTDPSAPVFGEGPLAFGAPGLGTLPGGEAPPQDLDERRFAAALAPATALRWRAGRLERSTPGVGPTGPWASSVGVVAGVPRSWELRVLGAAETSWTLELDAAGWPVAEHTRVEAPVQGLHLTVEQHIRYTDLGACP